MRVFDDALYLVPAEIAVETDADPAQMTDVRWHEELLGTAGREHLLHVRRGCAPERETPVVVVVVQVHDERALVADEEGGRAVARALIRIG